MAKAFDKLMCIGITVCVSFKIGAFRFGAYIVPICFALESTVPITWLMVMLPFVGFEIPNFTRSFVDAKEILSISIPTIRITILSIPEAKKASAAAAAPPSSNQI